METLKLLGISEDDNKYYFVGKEYGYTGNTCPILCLNRLWDIYSKKGTKIIICTVGAGYHKFLKMKALLPKNWQLPASSWLKAVIFLVQKLKKAWKISVN